MIFYQCFYLPVQKYCISFCRVVALEGYCIETLNIIIIYLYCNLPQVCLSVSVRKLLVAILARSSREMSRTVRNV